MPRCSGNEVPAFLNPAPPAGSRTRHGREEMLSSLRCPGELAMRRLRFVPGCVLCLLLFTGAVRAEAPPDPLRLVPEQADLFFKVEKPAQLLDAVRYAEILEQLQAFSAVREAFDSTNTRRLLQLLTYFEKQLGLSRMEMLDQLAGGGAVLGVKVGKDPAPALLVVQGKDEKLQRKFFHLAVELIESELARQESKQSLKKHR